MPDRSVFHVTEILAYLQAAIHLEAHLEEYDAAVEHLNMLIDLDIDKKQLEKNAKLIGINRMMTNMKQLSAKAPKHREVIGIQKLKWTPAKDAPELQHPELQVFYSKQTENFSEADIQRIMALPRETLISDLEAIVRDSIYRNDFFQELDYNYDTHEFLCHALYFLGALKSESSFPIILDLFRMGNDFIENWFADMTDVFLFPTLYFLGEKQLHLFRDMVLEEHINSFNRDLVASVPAQLALHQPDRRDEVIAWFREVILYLLEHPKNKGLIDTDFITYLVGHILCFRGIELLPLIQQISERGWINASFQGNISEIEKEFLKDSNPFQKKALPTDIYDFYSGNYLSIKQQEVISYVEAPELNPAEKLISEVTFNQLMGGLDEEEEYDDDAVHTPMQPLSVTAPIKGMPQKQGATIPALAVAEKNIKNVAGLNNSCCFQKSLLLQR